MNPRGTSAGWCLPTSARSLTRGPSWRFSAPRCPFAWSLPWVSDDGRLFRVRPLLNAVCYSATGLLAWTAGSTLSPLGHGFVLAGAALASGMLVLALTQVLGYARDSRSAVLGPVARWLYRVEGARGCPRRGRRRLRAVAAARALRDPVVRCSLRVHRVAGDAGHRPDVRHGTVEAATPTIPTRSRQSGASGPTISKRWRARRIPVPT